MQGSGLRPADLAAALDVPLPFAPGSAAAAVANAAMTNAWIELYPNCQQALLFGCVDTPLTGRVCNVSVSISAHAAANHVLAALAVALDDAPEAVKTVSDG